MNGLVEWLRGVLDSLERTAQEVLSDYAAHEASWSVLSTGVVQLGDDVLPTADGPLAKHIAANDPASVLAQVTADRKVIDTYMAGLPYSKDDFALAHALANVVQIRAEAYAGRPGYREEWKP